jgi:hypothetical protein
MSNLLLERKLRTSAQNSDARKLARARTLTTLERLGPSEKRVAIQFLYKSGLIEGSRPVVALRGAYLSSADPNEANLSAVNLIRADLRGADFGSADLSEANLSEANLGNAELTDALLTGAHLTDANLTNASVAQEQLSQAASLEVATMPDGQK